MTEPQQQQYARLPAELLALLLDATPTVTSQVEELLGPALEQRDALRAAAISRDMIQTVIDGTPLGVCAVDGGFAVERTVAVDLVMSVAVGIEGFCAPHRTPAWPNNQYKAFHEVRQHEQDSERLARAAMMAQELEVLGQAPHDVRIFDGSHVTAVIQLNSGLSSHSASVRQAVLKICESLQTEQALKSFANHPRIVAMPKYDSSRQVIDILSADLGTHIGGDDRYVASLILGGGEYLSPMQVPADPWRELHLSVPSGAAMSERDQASRLNDQLQPLRNRDLYCTYWKPEPDIPAYRLEIKPTLANDTTLLSNVFATLAEQITGPFIREPYPQYLADVMAKSVGLGLSALQSAAHLSLLRADNALAEFLVHSYRTEGK